MSKKELRKIDITKIENPDFLHDLSYKELALLSEDIKNYIVNLTSDLGGHLSPNLGTIDATISLCRSFNFLNDKIIFDVGHQCYTYKILTGRNLEDLRKKGGTSGFQKTSESPYDHFEAGHSSTSISVANGMAIARDLDKKNYEVIAFIGDGSIVNGLALEGLNLAAQDNHKIIIVLNDNDMSINRPVGGLSKAFRKFSNSAFYIKSKSFIARVFGKRISAFLAHVKNWFKRHLISMNLFDILEYKMIGPVNGHDIKAMDKAFKQAKKFKESVVVHIKTVKGHGYKPAEEDEYGKWHGVNKFDVESGQMIKDKTKKSWSVLYKEELDKSMAKHEEAVIVVPATGTGSHLGILFQKYPDRIIDVGIAEEHAVTMSGGLSISGKHPIISIYSTFLQRAYDEIHHDIARMNLGATFLVDRSGLVGEDGETHQGIYDEAFLLSIPNTIISMASNQKEAEYLLEESYKHNCPFFIRYPKENVVENNEEATCYEFGQWLVLNEATKKNVAIVSVGPLTRSLERMIKDEKIDATLILALFISPVDMDKVDSLLAYKNIIIYDAYATENGFARYLESILTEKGYKGNIILKAVPNTYVKQASVDEQREEFSLDLNSIKNCINLLK
ncbi:MAG: 1-deoxy-D-xylulose-5-phosphate synthase [Bacilli bacterium]|nr:1-deoxy-D-xylulose-5-phosphate synthase [Bacilli bacterium]